MITRMGRPIAPSLLIMLAEAWAMADPRCFAEAHNTAIATRSCCPSCHLALGDYVRQLDEVTWP